MARFGLLLLGLCGVACGGRIDDSSAMVGTVGGHAAGAPSAANGGAQPTVGTATGSGTLESAGGQKAGSIQSGGTPIAGAATAGPVKLQPISQDELARIRSNSCAGSIVVDSEVRDLQLEWLLDASSSQAEPASDRVQSKWELSRGLVVDTNAILAARGHCAAGCTGLLPFPLRETGALTTQPADSIERCIDLSQRVESMCFGDWSGVDLSPMAERLRNIVPVGGTPLIDAYRYAVGELIREGISDPTYLVLVTDAMPSIDADCRVPTVSPGAATPVWRTQHDDNRVAPTDPIVEEIASAYSQGIRTVVVGTASEPASRAWLSRAALAGGTAQIRCPEGSSRPYCHLDLTAEPDVASAIAQAVLPGETKTSCRFPNLASTLGDGSASSDARQSVPIIMAADPKRLWRVPFDAGPAEDCSEGFRQISAEEFELCPAACALLNNECMARLEIAQLCVNAR